MGDDIETPDYFAIVGPDDENPSERPRAPTVLLATDNVSIYIQWGCVVLIYVGTIYLSGRLMRAMDADNRCECL